MRLEGCITLVISLLALTPALAADPALPDQAKTPGAIDENVCGSEICADIWAKGTRQHTACRYDTPRLLGRHRKP
jgi:hypothetical protein